MLLCRSRKFIFKAVKDAWFRKDFLTTFHSPSTSSLHPKFLVIKSLTIWNYVNVCFVMVSNKLLLQPTAFVTNNKTIVKSLETWFIWQRCFYRAEDSSWVNISLKPLSTQWFFEQEGSRMKRDLDIPTNKGNNYQIRCYNDSGIGPVYKQVM